MPTTSIFADLPRRLSRQSDRYLYKQIKHVLREMVRREELKPGDPIPPMRELSKICQVSEVTVRRAVQELVREGIFSSRPGTGTSVISKDELVPSHGDRIERERPGYEQMGIGVVCADITEGYPLLDEFVKGMRSVIGDKAALQFIEQPVVASEAAEQAMRFPLSHFSGLILFAPVNLELVARCRREEVPYVLMFPSVAGGTDRSVLVECETGMADAMVHLHERGRNRIAFVSSGPHLWSTGQYTNAYRLSQRWLKTKQNSEWLIHAGQTEDDGYTATVQLLALDDRPDAIIYGTDFAAKGGLKALIENGMVVPKDMSIIGMGDALRTGETPIGITTLNIKVPEEGRQAVTVIRRLIDGDQDVPLETMIVPELIIREST